MMAWTAPFAELDDDWKAFERYKKGEFPSLEGNMAVEVIRSCWDEECESAQQVLDDLEKLHAR